MKTKFTILIVLFVNYLFAQQPLAIKNVTVISMANNQLLENQTVLVKNGLIEALDKKVKIPKSYKIIDGNGKFLMPGLTDTHVHFFQEQYTNHRNTNELELKLMLANGLTTARIMAGHPEYLAAKQNIQDKKWIGPDLLVASPQLVGSWPWEPEFKNYEIVDSPEKAKNAVKQFKAMGYDAIKITFMVSKPNFEAIVKAAKAENIKVVGHVGPKAKLQAALDAKMQIEHMDEFIDVLLPDISYNHGESVSDMNVWRQKAWNTVPVLMESKIPDLVAKVKQAGVYVSPTNYFFVSCFGTKNTDEYYKNRPDYQYIPKELLESRWDIKKRQRDMNLPQDSQDKYVMLRKKMVFELNKAGVPLMAGSDSPEWFLVAGFSVHDELKTFVEAGLSNFDALKTATITPSKYFNNNKGIIAKGKAADLLLLDKNPLENIENTRAISGVFKTGKYYSKEDLVSYLNEAKAISK